VHMRDDGPAQQQGADLGLEGASSGLNGAPSGPEAGNEADKSSGDPIVGPLPGGIAASESRCDRCGVVHRAPEEALEREAEACRIGEAQYVDPETGYAVLTSAFLARRKRCCGYACRHCPFGHFRVTWAAGRSSSGESSPETSW